MRDLPQFLGIFILAVLFTSPTMELNITYVSLHTDFGTLKYGYYVAAPLTEIATRHLRRIYPDTLADLTWIKQALPGLGVCDEASKLVSDFVARFYYEHPHLFREGSITVFGSSGKKKNRPPCLCFV